MKYVIVKSYQDDKHRVVFDEPVTAYVEKVNNFEFTISAHLIAPIPKYHIVDYNPASHHECDIIKPEMAFKQNREIHLMRDDFEMLESLWDLMKFNIERRKLEANKT